SGHHRSTSALTVGRPGVWWVRERGLHGDSFVSLCCGGPEPIVVGAPVNVRTGRGGGRGRDRTGTSEPGVADRVGRRRKDRDSRLDVQRSRQYGAELRVERLGGTGHARGGRAG